MPTIEVFPGIFLFPNGSMESGRIPRLAVTEWKRSIGSGWRIVWNKSRVGGDIHSKSLAARPEYFRSDRHSNADVLERSVRTKLRGMTTSIPLLPSCRGLTPRNLNFQKRSPFLSLVCWLRWIRRPVGLLAMVVVFDQLL